MAEPAAPDPSTAGDRPNRTPLVQLAPPVSDVPWSPDFMAQDLEILMVFLGPDGIRHLKPEHADSLRVGWSVGSDAGDIVVRTVRRYGLQPLVVHSTSWRNDDKHVVLTYLVVTDSTSTDPNGPLKDLPVGRADLARGEALSAPEAIGVEQVLEHALRHLAWLIKDDRAIAGALPAWAPALELYEPEPFRSFAGPPTGS